MTARQAQLEESFVDSLGRERDSNRGVVERQDGRGALSATHREVPLIATSPVG